MTRTQVSREQAQSFDRVAADYDRLGDLTPRDLLGSWCQRQLPAAGRHALDLGCGTGRHAALLATRFEHVDAVDLSGPMLEVARTRRALPNITYQQADLHDLTGAGQYDFILSLMTLHHVPDLHAALGQIRTLLAPGGRAVVADCYDHPADRWSRPWFLHLIGAPVPLRSRLRAQAALRFGTDLLRRGPATALERCRLATRREWLDHRVTDRFFSRAELERCCADLFPGCRLYVLGGPRGTGLVWDAPDDGGAR